MTGAAPDNCGKLPHLVLLGAGHAHVEVLRRTARRLASGTRPAMRITLLTRDRETAYSGLLPALIRRECRPIDAHIDCGKLAAAAGVRLLVADATAIDLAGRRVLTAEGHMVGFDVLAIDVGGSPDMPGEQAIAVKPIGGFLARLRALEDRLPPHATIAVVGTGAGGTELALALADRLAGRAGIALVGPTPPLASAPAGTRRAVRRALGDNAVRVVAGSARNYAHGRLTFVDGAVMPAAAAIWATGICAPGFLARAGLACGPDGCVLTDATLRSTSHAFVFATGDCATFEPAPRPKAGVWAVRAGPLLDANLQAACRGLELRAWHPPSDALAIIGLGRGRASAWRGGLSLSGRLAFWWKRQIDRRWMARYQDPS